MSFKTPASQMVVKWWVIKFPKKKSFEATQSFSCITQINIEKNIRVFKSLFLL